MKTLMMAEVEWTNPLTGDGEYCTVEFNWDEENDELDELLNVTWNRTGENCLLRYISSEVMEELRYRILQSVSNGDFDDELGEKPDLDSEED